MNAKLPPLFASPENSKLIQTMIGVSHRSPMLLASVLPWKDTIDRTRAPKRPDTGWMYGTPYWDQLTEAQRTEVLWLETARDVSFFIALEQYLPPMYMGYLIAFGAALDPAIEEYMMIFAKEEITHTMMFRRYLDITGLPTFELPMREGYAPVMHKLEHEPRSVPPIVGVLWTLILEWSAELNAMHGTQDDIVEPFTRKMFREHHVDEIRHITFGRRVVEDYFARTPQDELDRIRALLRPAVRDVFAEFRFTEQICDFTSFKFPFAKDDVQARAAVRASANNARLHVERFREMIDWLQPLGLLEAVPAGAH